MKSPRFGLCYDFRNPPDSGIANPDLYAAALDQMVWAEQLGLDQIWFTEHHFVDDGYLPSWVPVAAAAAARTSKIRFSTDICLLPFNNPVRLAEDLAILDNISNGRVEIGVGMGYAPHEFKGFGYRPPQRVSLMEEGLEVLQKCFSGEQFSFEGKRYKFEDVIITPGYVQEGGPPLWIAAMSSAGAKRAARFNTNFLPQGSRSETLDVWLAETKAAGRDPSDYRIGLIRSVLVTPGKERDWPDVRESERYRMRLYNRFFEESGEGLGGVEDQIPQTWIVGDVDKCVNDIVSFIQDTGITDIVSMAIPPGFHPDQMSDSIEAFATKVVPQVRARLA